MTLDPPALPTIRRRLAACLSALAREHHAFLSGVSVRRRSVGIFASFADLPARETCALVDSELAAAHGDPEEARRLRHLREGLALLCEEKQVAPVEEALATAEAELRSARALAPLHRDRIRRARAAAEDRGFECYESFFTATSGIDLDQLTALVAPLRRRGSERLGSLLAAAPPTGGGVLAGGALREDLTRRFRAAHFDPFFPADGAAPLARTIVERDLGLDLGAGGRLQIELVRHRDRPRRAFTAAIEVPAEVRLVARPAGGADAYAAFFHELGHALHLAHVDPSLPLEYRRLGDSSVTEGFAALLEGILRERPFAERHLGSGAETYLQHAAFVDLWMLCRYAAKLDFERELWRAPDHELDQALDGGPDRLAGRYAAHLESATHLPVEGELCLSDLDLRFQAARYLRAWLLAAILRRQLKADFGEAWFESRRAGRYLREIWATGQRWNAEELARALGAEGLGGEPLQAEVEALAP